MRKFFSFCALIAAVVGADPCSKPLPADIKPGQQTVRTLQVTDTNPKLGEYSRKYLVRVPRSYTGKESLPIVWYFHGWGEDFPPDVNKFFTVGDEHNFIVVAPKGEDDGAAARGWFSWNVGSGGRKDVCVPRDSYNSRIQYASCKTIAKTGPCNCYTCYDDVNFVSDLTMRLTKDLCIDPDKTFATGASNGAMFLYYLAAQLVHRNLKPKFRAILPNYGAFLLNSQDVPAALANMSLFALHGLQDTEIPPAGGEADDGWLYTPIHTTLTAYGSMKGCKATASRITTRFDGRQGMKACYEHKGCSVGRVVRCNFAEKHGFWESYQEEMIWWFFSSTLPEASNRIDWLGERNEETALSPFSSAKAEAANTTIIV